MNWDSIIRFRKHVEDMVREELALAEWDRRQYEAQYEALRRDSRKISLELDHTLQLGAGQVFANQRFQWLEEISKSLQQCMMEMKRHDQKIAGLRDQLREAHQMRRAVEMVSARKRAKQEKTIAMKEQVELDECAANRYRNAQCQEIV